MNALELPVGLLLAELLCSVQISLMLLLNLLSKAVFKQFVPFSVTVCQLIFKTWKFMENYFSWLMKVLEKVSKKSWKVMEYLCHY